MTPVAHAIQLSNLSKRYDATVALDRVSLQVAAGSVHALLGENGAGKSTVVKILSGLTQPDSGEIAVLGQPARLHGPLDSHRLGIQTAFQEMTLVRDLTITQNMLLPYEPTLLGQVRRRRSEQQVAAIFERYEVRGIDPRQEVREVDLPTRQKIEIVKAVARGPRVLLLDEPTSALDAASERLVRDAIDAIPRDRTVLIVAHRLSSIRHVDRILAFDQGRLVEDGTHAELLARNGLYARLWRDQGEAPAVEPLPV